MSQRTTQLTVTTLCAFAFAVSLSSADSDRTILQPLAQDGLTKIVIPGTPAFELAELKLPEGLPNQTTVRIPIEGTLYDVDLYRFSMRSADFELLVDDGEQLNLTEAPEPKTYRGTVAGLAGSSARASLLDSGLFGRVDLGEDLGTWFIQPLHSFEEDEVTIPRNMSLDTHVIYPETSGFLPGYHCGNEFRDMDQTDTDMKPGAEGASGGVAGATIYYVEIAFDTDYEFFQRNASNVQNTIDDIELIYLLVENIYEDDVSINFEISTIVVRSSSSDPYSGNDADDILCGFRSVWNSGDEDDIRRDVAQIFTGKNVTGGTLGVAWLGVVCNLYGTDCGNYNNLAYGMCESKYTSTLTYRTSLHAHELGHNFNAPHCDSQSECRIMCSGNGACDYPNAFAPASISYINSFRGGMSCDTILGDELTLPFSDDFSSLSSSIWNYNKGGARSASADNEPSPTYSLQLDSTGSGTYADDEIRSRTMLGSGYDPMYISFHTQHKGVESGKSLIVDYFNSSSEWTELTEIVSDGSDQTQFVFHEFEMGSDAKTNRLRIRFRTNGTSSTDDWYIDDLEIDDSAEEPPVDPPANDECSDAVFLEPGLTTFSTLGATDSAFALPASCDEGDGIEMRADVWFQFLTTCVGTVTITTCGSTELDTRIAVYNGLFGCPYTESHLIACNDDNASCGDDALVITTSTISPLFYIRVGNRNGETAENVQLVVSCEEDEVPCDGDVNGDGSVDGADLAQVLGSWGTPDGDQDGNGTTDGADLSIVLGGWGDCP